VISIPDFDTLQPGFIRSESITASVPESLLRAARGLRRKSCMTDIERGSLLFPRRRLGVLTLAEDSVLC